MTDDQAILAFLAIATTINFALIGHLLRQSDEHLAPPDLLFPAGVQVEDFVGRSRAGAQVAVAAGDTAYALIFLSSGCPKCRAAAPDVAAAAALATGRGVRLWMVTAEWLSAADLGESAELDAYFLDLARVEYAMLNPRRASPVYLFISADMIAEASGFIGDDNWQSFIAQLAEPV